MTRPRSFWLRVWELVVPPVTDFHALMEEQCANLEAAVSALDNYLKLGDATLADAVRDRVREGHALRDRNLTLLYRAFVTQIDREDIYTLCTAIDHILDYVKNTVREVEVLQVRPDKWTHQMAQQLGEGAASLARGLELLRSGRAMQVPETVITRRLERYVEKLYREALAEMFQGSEYRALTESTDDISTRACLDFVVVRIKRREVYRHLSNAADRLAHAGEVLRDVSVKYE